MKTIHRILTALTLVGGCFCFYQAAMLSIQQGQDMLNLHSLWTWGYFICLFACILFAITLLSIGGKGTQTHGSAGHATNEDTSPYRPHNQLVTWIWHRATGKPAPQESRFLLGSYKGTILSLSERQQDSNILLTAPVGSGKSSRVIIPNLLRERGTRSLFIADLKGELYDICAGALVRKHRLWLFAPTYGEESQGYNPLAHINTVEEAQEFAQCWVQNTGTSNDEFWQNNARLLIMATVLHLRKTEPNAPFSRLAEFLTESTFEEIKEALSTSPAAVAKREAKAFLNNMSLNERLVGSVMTDIGNRFQLLASEHIRRVTAHNGLDFQAMIDTPTAFILSMPRNAAIRLRPLMATLTMQMFNSWERYAERRPGRQLPRQVACYLDEFTNIGSIPGFAEFISSARSKRIALILAIQTFSQLDAKYGEEDAETIKNNCVTHLLLSGAGLEETKYYSERIGDTTVPSISKTASTAIPILGYDSVTHGETRRRLLTPEEIRMMAEDTLLMLSKSSPPFLVKTKAYFQDRQLSKLANLEIPRREQPEPLRTIVKEEPMPSIELITPTSNPEDTEGQEQLAEEEEHLSYEEEPEQERQQEKPTDIAKSPFFLD